MDFLNPRPNVSEIKHERTVFRCGLPQAKERVVARKVRTQGNWLTEKLEKAREKEAKGSMYLVMTALIWMIQVKVQETGTYGDRPLYKEQED